jgi:hypothetical protein
MLVAREDMMKPTNRRNTGAVRLAWQAAATLLLAIVFATAARALTINVVGADGGAVGEYRWLLQEDATKASVPGEPAGASHLSLNFHTSYMPVLKSGTSASPTVATDATKRYYVSVLPSSGYQLGGAAVSAGQTSVTITVNKLPMPTAQISIFVFEDNQPINGAPNLPQELGLGGFSVILAEAGGTYGQSGGQVTQDGFGNPLGTTYKQNPDGSFVFNADGSPQILVKGNGFIITGPDGVARIKNLFPAKYTVTVSPPPGSDWHQTSTIEGTKGIDAWVKANEPPFFQEFGPPGHHIFMGFVRTINNPAVLNGSTTITGRVVNTHTSRPPNYSFYNGAPFPQCWVGLNELPAAGGRGVFTKPCNADSTFSIPNVPPGQYQLVIWDDPLDIIIATSNVTEPAGVNTVNLQEVPVFNWFGRFESRVFFDADENGFRGDTEAPIPGQNINLRFRDGSIYQSYATNPQGVAVFNEVFPFFNWLIAEVDFARFKATGATIIVDAGGPIAPHNGWINPSFGRLNPQLQPENGNKPYRTETGPVLLQGMQLFLGQTNVIEWGKSNYGPGQNGGITGIVHYATTRAEDDPRYAAAENWEPGIPRVQVNLYRDCNGDGIIDVPNRTPGSSECVSLGSAANPPKLADVDNWPFGWADGGEMGPEDVKRNSDPGFSIGDAYQFTTTDAWDDNLPSGCVGPAFVSNGYTTDCFDGLRNFNQVRPAVFDGGYAFGSPLGDPDLPPGRYIVEAIAPPGYLHQGNGDKNVDFGETITPSPLLLPPVCVGDLADVPQYLNLFPADQVPNPNYTGPGLKWAQCDRKAIDVGQGKNAAADFYMFTEVPVAATLTGFILDDTANEFDPNAPTFGERHAPPWIPVSIQDWTGREISRVYSDQWGLYNAMVPSTYTINPPFPSGVMPNMITTCINSPGPIIDTRPGSATYGQQILDPYFQRQYSQFCYTFQYMPGKTTYLDTPVIPVAAFAGPGQVPLDCEFEDGTPMIYSVTGRAPGSGLGGAPLNGPWVPTPGNTGADSHPRLGIVSAGMVEVSNPAYGLQGEPKTIMRDFGFGATQGTGGVTLGGVNLPVVQWNNDIIYVRVPPAAAAGGQLMITRDNQKTTIVGLTVTVGGPTPKLVAPGGSIQQVVDSAANEDLILVAPGTYNELVIMNKKVKLQGWGAPSTTINAMKSPAEKLHNWRVKVGQLAAAGTFDLVPGQELGFDAPNNEPTLFTADEGPGILVVAKDTGPNRFTNADNARIDGFTITGADAGGGIFVSGFARYLEISNNRVIGNYGTYGGGIRLGHPLLVAPGVTPATDTVRGGYSDSQNDSVHIHHNHITQNGASDVSAAGAGIALCNGSHNYRVNRNYVCGNFSLGNGGGIGHLGLSNNGSITRNTVLFNQSFNQGQGVNGGGIFVGGQPSLAVGGLSPGSGNVEVNANLIQGNQAGAGDGGGIRAQAVNGLDVSNSRNSTNGWYTLTVLNNMIANNMAALAGGGISLQDAVLTTIGNNTIAHNDSTGTAGAAFAPNSPNQSTPQPAGIVSRAHTTLLFTTIGNGSGQKKEFSDALLVNNIIWRNRAFYWVTDLNTTPNYHLVPNIATGQAPVYSDLGVLGTSAQASFPLYVGAGTHQLTPRFSILTNGTGHPASNFSANPMFMASYFNGDRGQTIQIPEITTTMTTAPAFDEGGNFIDVRFGPLTLWKKPCPASGTCLYGDYHVRLTSPALGAGSAQISNQGWNAPTSDFDGQSRPLPSGTSPDIGADERNQ